MKYTVLLIFLLVLGFSSCSDDPCETVDNLECDTQDFDMDGVANGEDEAPENACIPNMLAFEELVVGTWTWGILGNSGEVNIKSDGTYEDIESSLVSNGDVVSRVWTIELFTTLKFQVENVDGLKASITLKSTDRDCNKITFDGQGFGDIIFNRK